jgi:hsp70-interacting protein
MNPELNNLLRWGIQNSGKSEDKTTEPTGPPKKLDMKALDAIFGGPSDADLMRDALTVVKSPDSTLENKMIAFDNFEQMIENLDNANNIENLKLWIPLYEELDNKEPQLRTMAAWCIATAIQNNIKSQENVSIVLHSFITQLTRIVHKDRRNSQANTPGYQRRRRRCEEKVYPSSIIWSAELPTCIRPMG